MLPQSPTFSSFLASSHNPSLIFVLLISQELQFVVLCSAVLMVHAADGVQLWFLFVNSRSELMGFLNGNTTFSRKGESRCMYGRECSCVKGALYWPRLHINECKFLQPSPRTQACHADRSSLESGTQQSCLWETTLNFYFIINTNAKAS